jgi:hypothetical protein
MAIQLGTDLGFEHREEFFDESGASHHPLEVAPTTVVVRPVEARARDPIFEPAQQRFVTDVHLQCDVRLSAVAAEVALTDQQTDHHPLVPLVEHCRIVSPGRKT